MEAKVPLAFLAGLVSFATPCVLPLVPGYLATISGASFEPSGARTPVAGRHVVIASALFFVGFLIVFIACA